MAKLPPRFRPAQVPLRRLAREADRMSSAGRRVRGRRGQRMRKRRLQRAGWLCVDCRAAGRVTAATVIDHIVPLALGGEDVDSNCRALCDECHRRRTAEQFGRAGADAVGEDGWRLSGRGAGQKF